MHPFWGHVAGIFIVLMMIAFIGIWIWAWLPYHKRTFGWLASLPMEDTERADEVIPPTDKEECR